MMSSGRRMTTRSTRERLLISMHYKGQEETLAAVHRGLAHVDQRMRAARETRLGLVDSPEQNSGQKAYEARGPAKTLAHEAGKQVEHHIFCP